LKASISPASRAAASRATIRSAVVLAPIALEIRAVTGGNAFEPGEFGLQRLDALLERGCNRGAHPDQGGVIDFDNVTGKPAPDGDRPRVRFSETWEWIVPFLKQAAR
jgi:hypothetical protein